MRMHGSVLILSSAILAACASSPPGLAPAPVAAPLAESKYTFTEEVATPLIGSEPEPQVICRSEYPTGSHRKRTVCRTLEQIEQDRTHARHFMRRATSGSSLAGSRRGTN